MCRNLLRYWTALDAKNFHTIPYDYDHWPNGATSKDVACVGLLTSIRQVLVNYITPGIVSLELERGREVISTNRLTYRVPALSLRVATYNFKSKLSNLRLHNSNIFILKTPSFWRLISHICAPSKGY